MKCNTPDEVIHSILETPVRADDAEDVDLFDPRKTPKTRQGGQHENAKENAAHQTKEKDMNCNDGEIVTNLD